MAISFATDLKNDRLNVIDDQVNAGAAGGTIKIYNGTRPANGGTATTLLAELTFSVTAFASATGGILTANSISDETSAVASGTATWFRVADSNGQQVMDGSVGSDLILTPAAITAGQVVSITSFVVNSSN